MIGCPKYLPQHSALWDSYKTSYQEDIWPPEQSPGWLPMSSGIGAWWSYSYSCSLLKISGLLDKHRINSLSWFSFAQFRLSKSGYMMRHRLIVQFGWNKKLVFWHWKQVGVFRRHWHKKLTTRGLLSMGTQVYIQQSNLSFLSLTCNLNLEL